MALLGLGRLLAGSFSLQEHQPTSCVLRTPASELRLVVVLQVHTHASYSYCDEGDAFRTASYLANMKQPGASRK